MLVRETSLPDVFVFEPKRFGDGRGFFSETWNQRRMADAGFDLAFVQDNHSLSDATGTIRGLHFQAPPHAQAKLVRCGRGSILDVAVDIRVGSPHYGQWVTEKLSSENGRQLLVPEGFLHGFITREPMTEVYYKCTDFYVPEADGGVRWDSCGIDWGVDGDVILSDKDAAAPVLSDFQSPFFWSEA